MIDQPPQDSLVHWLYTNAPAAWFTALVAFAALILRLRKKPKRIVVTEFPPLSLLRIQPEMRHRIRTTFDDRPVNLLSSGVYELLNEGSEPIRNAVLTLTLPEETTVLKVAVWPPASDPQCEIVRPNEVKATLPYLNPFREHKHRVFVQVLADGETRPTKATGSGEGWSLRFTPFIGSETEPLPDLSIGKASIILFGFLALDAFGHVARMGLRGGMRDMYEGHTHWTDTALIILAAVASVVVAFWPTITQIRMFRRAACKWE